MRREGCQRSMKKRQEGAGLTVHDDIEVESQTVFLADDSLDQPFDGLVIGQIAHDNLRLSTQRSDLVRCRLILGRTLYENNVSTSFRQCQSHRGPYASSSTGTKSCLAIKTEEGLKVILRHSEGAALLCRSEVVDDEVRRSSTVDDCLEVHDSLKCTYNDCPVKDEACYEHQHPLSYLLSQIVNSTGVRSGGARRKARKFKLGAK